MSDARAECDWCELPLAASWWGGRPEHDANEPAYCCLGCRIAADVARERGEPGRLHWTLVRLGLGVFLSMNVMVFTMSLWSLDLYEFESTAFTEALAGLFRHLGMLFTLPVLFLLGQPLVVGAWDAHRRGVPSADGLIAVGVLAAFGYSGWSVWTGGTVYFEVPCMVLVMVTIGRWLEANGRSRATRALDALDRLLPETVRLVDEDDEQERSLEAVTVGSVVRVVAGERVPVDGVIRRGSAHVDEGLLSGESWPVEKTVGDGVLAGTLNLDGDVDVLVRTAPANGTIARMKEVVRTARERRGPYHRLADRVAAWFLPVVVGLAIATFAVHTMVTGPDAGLLAGLAVLVVACPCALGLATPVAVSCALAGAARRGIVFTSGEAIERLATVRALRFDKTGTLTDGSPTVESFTTTEGRGRDFVLGIAAALAEGTLHVLSTAIRHAFDGHPVDLRDVRTWPGLGVEGEYRGTLVRLGSRRFVSGAVEGAIAEAVAAAESRGRPVSLLSVGDEVAGAFVFSERLRDEAVETLRLCGELGLDVAILTGDHAARGEAVAEALGVRVRAALSPEDKLAEVARTRVEIGPVAMVGDGLNDGPALAASDVGIAMGCGTDVARGAAGVCLVRDDLRGVPEAIETSRRTVGTIRTNLAWAFGYNAVGIGLAAAGMLNPAVAAALMVVSSLCVLTNSLRLLPAGVAETAEAVAVERRDSSGLDAAAALTPTGPRSGPATASLTSDL